MKRTMKWAVLLVALAAVLSLALGASAEGKKLRPRIKPLAEEPVPMRGEANITGVKNDGTTCTEYTYTVNNGTDTGVVWYEYAMCMLDDPRQGAYADTLYASDWTKSNEFTYTFYQTGTYVLFVYRYDADGNVVMNNGRNNVQTRIYITQDSAGNPLTQAVARAANACQRSSEFETAVAINDYLAEHVTYDYSYTYYSPEAALLHARGVCNSYSRAYELIAHACGLGCLRVNGVAGEDHAWNAVRINGAWYQVDPTWNDSDSKADRHLYMGLSDAVMGVDHFEFDYPYAEGTAVSCDSLEENYYFHTGIWRDMAGMEGSALENVQSALDGLAGSSGTITADFGRKAWLEGGESYDTSADTFEILGQIYAYALSRETLTRSVGGTETPMRGAFTYAYNSRGGTFTGTVAESGLTISGLAAEYDTGEPINATVNFDVADYAGDPDGLTLEVFVYYEDAAGDPKVSAMTEYDGEGLTLDITGCQLWENGTAAVEAVVRDAGFLVVSRARKTFAVQASHTWDLTGPAFPAYFTPGINCELQLFTGTEAAVHEGARMRVTVTAADGEGSHVRYDSDDLPLDETVRFTANAGEGITVELAVTEPGYACFHALVSNIPVLANLADADHPVTLTVEPAGSTQPICGTILATVEAEGAEWVRVADSNGNMTEPSEGDNVTMDLVLWEEETRYILWAEAGYADGTVYTSVPQAFELTKAGEILEVYLTTDLAWNTAIERGTPINVRFIEVYGFSGVPAGTAAAYEFNIESMSGEPADFRCEWTNAATHELKVHTEGMPSGAYRMSGMVYAPGYTPWRTGEIQFTVKDPAGTAPRTVSLAVDRTDAAAGEAVGITVYAKDAEWIRVFPDLYDSETTIRQDGAYCSLEHSYGYSGTYPVKARAFFTEDPGNATGETEEEVQDPENGTVLRHYWYLDSAVQTVTVTAGEDELVLPADLKRIEASAFEGVSARAVYIPAGCEYIDSGAFQNCPDLEFVQVYEGTMVDSGAFAQSGNVKIRVIPME